MDDCTLDECPELASLVSENPCGKHGTDLLDECGSCSGEAGSACADAARPCSDQDDSIGVMRVRRPHEEAVAVRESSRLAVLAEGQHDIPVAALLLAGKWTEGPLWRAIALGSSEQWPGARVHFW